MIKIINCLYFFFSKIRASQMSKNKYFDTKINCQKLAKTTNLSVNSNVTKGKFENDDEIHTHRK